MNAYPTRLLPLFAKRPVMPLRLRHLPVLGLILSVILPWLSGGAFAQETPSAELRSRLAGLARQANDASVQMAALEDLIAATPQKVAALETAIGQLENPPGPTGGHQSKQPHQTAAGVVL